MCTSRPASETAGDPARSAAGTSAASVSRSVITPSGPSTTRSAQLDAEPPARRSDEQTSKLGRPSSAHDVDRLERLDVAEVVADEDHPARVVALPGRRARRCPLCMPRRADLEHHAGRARGAGRARSAASPSGTGETREGRLRGRRAGGCGRRSRAPSPRRARRRLLAAQQVRGSSSRNAASPSGGSGRREPGGCWSPSARGRTGPCTARSASGAARSADLVEVAEGDHLARGPTGDHRDRPHVSARARPAPRCVGVDGGPTPGRPRSATGCRRSRGHDHGAARRPTRSSYRRCARSLRKSMAPANQRPAAGRRAPGRALRRSRR